MSTTEKSTLRCWLARVLDFCLVHANTFHITWDPDYVIQRETFLHLKALTVLVIHSLAIIKYPDKRKSRSLFKSTSMVLAVGWCCGKSFSQKSFWYRPISMWFEVPCVGSMLARSLGWCSESCSQLPMTTEQRTAVLHPCCEFFPK